MLLVTLKQTVIDGSLHSKKNGKTFPWAFGKGQIWLWCGPGDGESPIWVLEHCVLPVPANMNQPSKDPDAGGSSESSVAGYGQLQP